MRSPLACNEHRLARLEAGDRPAGVKGPHDYADDPVGYARDILKLEYVWSKQAEIAEALLKPPHRVLVRAGHKLGKSLVGGWLINWFYDSFNPSVCISTAPKFESVKKILWKEVRRLRRRAGLGGLQPKAPELSDAPDHIASGQTANSGEGFQGQHEGASMILFDEAVGVDGVFWDVAESLWKPGGRHFWIVFLNPTDTTCQAYFEEQQVDLDGNPKWTVKVLDCLEHPNVLAELKGGPAPIPAAVSLAQVNGWLHSYGCTEVGQDGRDATCIEWPPESGRWWKQGPVFQARCRGIWPTSGGNAVWSELLWDACVKKDGEPNISVLPEIGIDVARYGDDFTTFHVRWGHASFHHESHQGWSTDLTADRAKDLAAIWAAEATRLRPSGSAPVKPEDILIKADDDGVGGGVVDQLLRARYTAIGIGAGTRSVSGRYNRMRSELWFQVAERALAGEVCLGRLRNIEDRDALKRMRQQALITGWELNAAGHRVVWEKDIIKKLISRSPDDLDAFNLAYLQGVEFHAPEVLPGPKKKNVLGGERRRPGMFGG